MDRDETVFFGGERRYRRRLESEEGPPGAEAPGTPGHGTPYEGPRAMPPREEPDRQLDALRAAIRATGWTALALAAAAGVLLGLLTAGRRRG